MPAHDRDRLGLVLCFEDQDSAPAFPWFPRKARLRASPCRACQRMVVASAESCSAKPSAKWPWRTAPGQNAVHSSDHFCCSAGLSFPHVLLSEATEAYEFHRLNSDDRGRTSDRSEARGGNSRRKLDRLVEDHARSAGNTRRAALSVSANGPSVVSNLALAHANRRRRMRRLQRVACASVVCRSS